MKIFRSTKKFIKDFFCTVSIFLCLASPVWSLTLASDILIDSVSQSIDTINMEARIFDEVDRMHYFPRLIASKNFIEDLKIFFKREGGFAGRKINTEINFKQLSKKDKQELSKLIESVEIFNLPVGKTELFRDGDIFIADDFRYEITFQLSGKSRTIITGGENSPDLVRPLINFLNKIVNME
ncbi:MAG: protealysin inhibitor emfourin [Cyanobacteria bacterium P01_F01_bin.143]